MTPASSRFLPVAHVDANPQVSIELVSEVLRSGQLAQGPMTERFETDFAALCDVEHAVAVANGTVALSAALLANGIGPGDEVITSPFTFAGTLNAIVAVGASAHLVDIGEDFCLDPAAVGAAIGAHTKAIMPVHLYGQCADMYPILELADTYDLAVIEDAAQAHGATYDGRPAGSFGTGGFSFYATKNVTAGEGGMVTTNDDVVAAFVRTYRNQGMRSRYDHVGFGVNARMTDLQSAVALAQLPDLATRNDLRRRHADALTKGLADVTGIVAPIPEPNRTHVWHHYTIRVEQDCRVDRDELSTRLAEVGIGSGLYYPRLAHDYACFHGSPSLIVDALPVAERFSRQILSLPVHPGLDDADIDRVVAAVRRICGAT